MNARLAHHVIHLLVTACVVTAALVVYDRTVIQPARLVGTVDVAEVYRLKEAQFTRLLTQPASEDDRQKALEMARVFSQRLPAALAELPRECGCLVILKASLAGATPHTVDLTAYLKQKVGLP